MESKEKASARPSFNEFPAVSYEEWKKEAVASLKGGEFDKKLLTRTYEGITLQPLYTKNDFPADEEFPGEGDYLRGTDAAGYLDEPWAISQPVSAGCPDAANAAVKHQLDRGCTGINIKLDSGFGTGKCCGDGVCLCCKEDAVTLFDGVDIAKYPLHIDAGITALPLFAALCDSKPTGCIGADPIGVLASVGKLPASPDIIFGQMAEVVVRAAEKAPQLRTVLVDGNVYAAAGANAVQELAYSMAAASAYIAALTERGISADTAAKSIRFSLSLGANFFMQIAKLRAARVLFSKIAAAYGAGEEARKIDIFARTSSFTKTVYDPYVNILRATTEAFSGVVGGVNGMAVSTLDEPLGVSDELSERIARNTQVMLKEEFSLQMPVDPAGGSWYVETLTRQVISAAAAEFKAVEAGGGILAMLKTGEVQARIAKTLDGRFAKLASRADRAVGTNMYANMQEKPLERAEAACSAKNCCKPANCKLNASTVAAVAAALDSGAMFSDVCASAFGEGGIEVSPLKAHRWTEQFEALRAATEAYEAKTGKTVKVFLANMGPVSQHKARADFAAGFFEVAHFEVLRNNGFDTVDAAAAAAVASDAAVAVICSTDATYPEIVPALAKAVKAASPSMLVMVAGAPAPEYAEEYKAAGVDDYIHVRANCLDVLGRIQSERGIG